MPTSEILRYAIDLRSMTGGRGRFTAEHDHYDVLPAHLVDKAKASAGGDAAPDDRLRPQDLAVAFRSFAPAPRPRLLADADGRSRAQRGRAARRRRAELRRS